jgi:hypothetical protein
MIQFNDFVDGIIKEDNAYAYVPNNERHESYHTITSKGADLKPFKRDFNVCSKCGGRGTFWEPHRTKLGRSRLVSCDHSKS